MGQSADLLPIIILIAIFALTAIRQIGNLRLQIWQIMLGGAVLTLITGRATPMGAMEAIDFDVLIFLFAMFAIGEALVKSGYLFSLASGWFGSAKNGQDLLLLILFIMGGLSALLMNDTIAIIGTPLILYFANRYGLDPKLMLIALCFAITTGSVLSPIGNPQNLLIAMDGEIKTPFITFFKYLVVPTIINMALAFLILKFLYRRHLGEKAPESHVPVITDERLAKTARLSLMVLVSLIFVKVFAGEQLHSFKLTYIAILAALPVFLFSSRRFSILKGIDWHTLVFFGAMFIVMDSVWESGIIQSFMQGNGSGLKSTDMILGLSVILSQFLSNVPFVALYMPVLSHLGGGTAEMMALAAGSTIAGNLLILGAASNVIVIQGAERKGVRLGFLEFFKAGLPVTIVNVAVYAVYFRILVFFS